MIPPLSEGQERSARCPNEHCKNGWVGNVACAVCQTVLPEALTFDGHVPRPLSPIGTAEVWRYLEDHSAAVMLYCTCSDEPRMMVNRATIPMWQCAACGSHLFSRTER